MVNTGLCRTRQKGLSVDFSQFAVGAVSAPPVRFWQFLDLTERDKLTCGSAEVGSEVHVKRFQDEAACT